MTVAGPAVAAPAAARVFHVVINPGARAGDPEATRAALEEEFAAAGQAVCWVPVRSPRQLGAASQAAAREAAATGGVLVAVGGDGTLSTCAQAAWDHGCPLGVVSHGTFNLFARVHGLPSEPREAARALIAAQPQPVQVGQVNGRIFLVNASLGLYPQLLQDREAFKVQFGRRRWVALLAGLVTLFKWRRQLLLDIEQGGQRVVLVTPTLFVGNNALQLERVGIAPDEVAQLGQGQLVALLVRPIGIGAMLGLLWRGALGQLGEAEHVRSFAFGSFTVRLGGRRAVKLAADGEVGRADAPLTFRVAPRPLQLMLPAPAAAAAPAPGGDGAA